MAGSHAVRAHVSEARHCAHRGQDPASQRAGRAHARDQSGSPGQKAPPPGDPHLGGGEYVSRDALSRGAQSPLRGPPASPVDFHTRRDPTSCDRDLYCLETTRVLSRDWVVRHENRGYQVLARGAARRYCAPGSRVLVRETEDGQVRLLVRAVDGREHELEWVPARSARAPRAARRRADRRPTRADTRSRGPLRRRRRRNWLSRPAQRAGQRPHARQRRGFKAYNARRRAEAARAAGTSDSRRINPGRSIETL